MGSALLWQGDIGLTVGRMRESIKDVANSHTGDVVSNYNFHFIQQAESRKRKERHDWSLNCRDDMQDGVWRQQSLDLQI